MYAMHNNCHDVIKWVDEHNHEFHTLIYVDPNDKTDEKILKQSKLNNISKTE